MRIVRGRVRHETPSTTASTTELFASPGPPLRQSFSQLAEPTCRAVSARVGGSPVLSRWLRGASAGGKSAARARVYVCAGLCGCVCMCACVCIRARARMVRRWCIHAIHRVHACMHAWDKYIRARARAQSNPSMRGACVRAWVRVCTHAWVPCASMRAGAMHARVCVCVCVCVCLCWCACAFVRAGALVCVFAYVACTPVRCNGSGGCSAPSSCECTHTMHQVA
jgi:hypothetical protein